MAYTIERAVKAAAGQVGYRESGTNKTRYNNWLGSIPGYPHGGYGYPWCASFQGWVADRAGGRAGVDYPKTAGCRVAVGWFRSHGRWSSSPHVGDWVFYGPGGGTHVELVVAVSAHLITTIGGNTSGSLDGRYFNGDGVYRKQVSRSSDRIYGYGRPKYEQEDDMPSAEEIATAVWKHKISNQFRPDGDGNPRMVAAEDFLEYTDSHFDRIMAALKALGADVDEDAIVAGVLAGLTPERIAEAIPAELAEQVVTALGVRLTPKE